MNASYEKVDKAGAVLFNVNPASPPQPVLTFWIVSAIALAGSVAGGSIGITLFFASLIAFGFFWTKKGASHREIPQGKLVSGIPGWHRN